MRRRLLACVSCLAQTIVATAVLGIPGCSSDAPGSDGGVALTPEPSSTDPAARDLSSIDLIVDSQELVAMIERGQPVQVIDARPVDGYLAGHILSAVSMPAIDLEETRDGVSAMAATPGNLATALSAAGVLPGGTVVVYDDDGGKVASRLFWLLEYMDHPDVRLLDGGLTAWIAGGGLVTAEVDQATPTRYPVRRQLGRLATAADLETLGPSVLVIGARSEAEYSGERVRAARGGHIPGAVLSDWTTHRQADGRFLSMEALRQHYADTGAFDATMVIVYCQSGQRATHTYVALRALGVQDVRIYDASWEEWGNSDRPVVTGMLSVSDVGNCDVQAWLERASISLRGCDLSAVNLEGAALGGADLSDTVLARADLRGAELTEANLSRTRAPGANLSGIEAAYVDLTGADLTNADLSDADLRHAILAGASLVDARLTGADLEDAYLEGVDLTGVEWWSTICPDGTNSDDNGGTCEGHLASSSEPEADPCA